MTQKDVIMPALGMAQETGTLLKWLKNEGDTVTKGEPIIEVETDKAVVEVEAPLAGILSRLSASAGEAVPVGQVVAVIISADAAKTSAKTLPSVLPEKSVVPPQQPIVAREKTEINHGVSVMPPMTSHSIPSKILASPKAKRLAKEKNLELLAVKGTGPQGAVLAADVLQFVSSPSISSVETSQLQATRQPTHELSAPHFSLECEVKAGVLLGCLEKLNKRSKRPLMLADVVAKFVAVTLKKYPILNAVWQEGQWLPRQNVHICLNQRVIPDADVLGLTKIASYRVAEEVSSVSEEETFRVLGFSTSRLKIVQPALPPAHAAALGVGGVYESVVPMNGQATVHPVFTVVLTCRADVVSQEAESWLELLVDMLEDPTQLFMLF